MFVALAILIAYQIVTNSLGVSVGKLVLGIRVVNREAGRPGIGAGLVRSAFTIFVPLAVVVSFLVMAESARSYQDTHDDASFILVWWFLFSPLLAGVWAVESMVALLDDNRQALHDKLADTFVVRGQHALS